MDAGNTLPSSPLNRVAPDAASPDGMRHGPSLLQSMWRYRAIVVSVTLLAAVAGYGLALAQPVRYEASGRMFLADPTESQVFTNQTRWNLDLTIHTSKELQRIESLPVLTRAAELLGVDAQPARLRNRIETGSTPELGLITIAATAPTAQEAAQVADAVAAAYADVVAQRTEEDTQRAVARLQESADEDDQRIAAIAAQLARLPEGTNDFALESELEGRTQERTQLRGLAEQLAVESALSGSGVELYEPAMLPESPSGTQPVTAAALAAFLGLAASAVFAWWNAGRNQKALTSGDPGAVLGVPLLGAIQRFRPHTRNPSNVWTLSGVGTAAAESYQFVAAALELAVEEMAVTTVMFTSAEAGEGKTMSVLNVATAAGRSDRRVAVVDADIRARTLSLSAGAGSAPGLTDLGLLDVDPRTLTTPLRTRINATANERAVALVPAGSRMHDQAGFFRTPAFRKSMVRVKEVADFVLIDSPPLLAVSDSLTIASQAEAVVMVVSRGTDLRHLAEARRRLDLVGAPLIGYIFNRDSARGGSGYSYYGERQRENRANVPRAFRSLAGQRGRA